LAIEFDSCLIIIIICNTSYKLIIYMIHNDPYSHIISIHTHIMIYYIARLRNVYNINFRLLYCAFIHKYNNMCSKIETRMFTRLVSSSKIMYVYNMSRYLVLLSYLYSVLLPFCIIISLFVCCLYNNRLSTTTNYIFCLPWRAPPACT